MVEDIPPIDPDLNRDEQERNLQREKLEYELLFLEQELLTLDRDEKRQRYIIKWLAVIIGVVVIFSMIATLAHLVHRVFFGPFIFVSPAFSVAMIAVPIMSITAITIAFFVGAFRKFEDKDIEKMGNGVANAANMMRGS